MVSKMEQPQNKVWIVSDTHFFHFNSISYCNRPFKDVEEMNKVLIKNWNNVVSKTDKVFHLGDFAFGKKSDIKELVPKLHGYKILILGNHDRRTSQQFFLNAGFSEVHKWPIIYAKHYILSHEPIDRELIEGTNFKNLHGHTHQRIVEGNNYINCCIECTSYSPVLFRDILKNLKNRS